METIIRHILMPSRQQFCYKGYTCYIRLKVEYTCSLQHKFVIHLRGLVHLDWWIFLIFL